MHACSSARLACALPSPACALPSHAFSPPPPGRSRQRALELGQHNHHLHPAAAERQPAHRRPRAAASAHAHGSHRCGRHWLGFSSLLCFKGSFDVSNRAAAVATCLAFRGPAGGPHMRGMRRSPSGGAYSPQASPVVVTSCCASWTPPTSQPSSWEVHALPVAACRGLRNCVHSPACTLCRACSAVECLLGFLNCRSPLSSCRAHLAAGRQPAGLQAAHCAAGPPSADSVQ